MVGKKAGRLVRNALQGSRAASHSSRFHHASSSSHGDCRSGAKARYSACSTHSSILPSSQMTNSTATASSRAQSGQAGKGEKGTSRKTIPPPTGAFALPPARPEYFEEDGLRKVKPYMFVRTAASDGTARLSCLPLFQVHFPELGEGTLAWTDAPGCVRSAPTAAKALC